MNSKNFLFFGAACLLAAGVLGAEKGVRGALASVVAPRKSHEDLAKKQRPRDASLQGRTMRLSDLKKVHRESDPEGDAEGEVPVRKQGLIARSTILSGKSEWTIVPKGAVLHVPPRHQSRVNGKRHGKLVGWQEFLAKNSSWILLERLSFAQASGGVPLNEEAMKAKRGTGRVMVAICKGGPISVLPPKPEPADPEAAAALARERELKKKADAKTLKDLKGRLQKGLR